MKRKCGWVVMPFLLTLVMTACDGIAPSGDDSSNVNNETGSAAAAGEEPYEIVYAYPIFESVPADIQSVQDEMNKVIQAKINATVKLLPISNSAFTNQINLMMSGGEKLDMIVMLGNYSNQVSKGALYPIGNIMEENAQGIIDALGEEYYNATKINGMSYGVPSIRDLAQDFGFVLRKDVVDKHGIDLSQVRAFDDFEKIFKVIKEKEPGMVGATNLGNGSILSTYRFNDPLGNDLGVLLNHGLDDLKVVNWFASEQYERIVRKLREWYLAGYLPKDAATNPEMNQAVVKSGMAAGWLSAMKPGFEAQESRGVGTEMVAVRTAQAVAKTDTVTNVTIGVATSSQNPAKTLQFLNLMYTDKEIVNLIDWGIEGKHYVKVDGRDNVITYPDGVTGENVGYKNYSWMQGNQFLSYVFEGDDPDVYKKMEEFNKSAAKSKALGFTFNGDAVKNEVAACTAVLEQYRRVIESGEVNVDKMLPEFLKKLEDAGIDKIVAEKQKQLDAWAASNGVK
ncbi:extracellular solute-binding protein [Paenibacillus antri]|uniref:Extracellular solute-binding protein n=1 Tax=Paenibacillus antri TaxID=2582848 RepID=A0A5R9GB75_9BACL|nr:ABC transporter substrate-binding protein [Paenibacillus antri]TLS53717.1 extracellular solute-binding protein [Paenibacillus antri]